MATDSSDDEQTDLRATWEEVTEARRISRPEAYPLTERDQLEAFFYVKMAFRKNHPRVEMPEMASIILEMAEYWLSRKAKRTDTLRVTEYDGEDVTYLRSTPIIGRAYRPVRKIIFRTVSHDQGWSSNPREFHGTYSEAFSWFQAGRAAGLVQSSNDAESTTVFDEIICKNIHASSVARLHEVCWPAIRAGPEGSETYENYHWVGGRNEERIEEWIKQLQLGDRVCLIPRALYPGWANNVYGAEIEIVSRFSRPA